MLFSVKIYPQTLWGEKYKGNFQQLLNELCQCGIQNIITPVFQGSHLFYPEQKNAAKNNWDLLKFQELCRSQDIGFIPEFPIFHDPDTYEKVPQYRPVNLNGEMKFPSPWYKPICPSNEPYRKYRLDLIFQAMEIFEPFLMNLEFLQYPYLPGTLAFDKKETSLPMYCYCDFCRYQFLDYSGQPNPLQDIEGWFAWRSENITMILILISEEIERRGVETQIIVQIPPASTPNAAEKIRRLTGQDIQQWRGLVHLLAPQMHFNQLGAKSDWALQFLKEFMVFPEFGIIPDIDLPEGSLTRRETEKFKEILDTLESLGVEAVTLFHADLLLHNENLKELLKKYTGR